MLSVACINSWTRKEIHKKPKVKSKLCFNLKFLHTVIHRSLHFFFFLSNFLQHKPSIPRFSMINKCVKGFIPKRTFSGLIQVNSLTVATLQLEYLPETKGIVI